MSTPEPEIKEKKEKVEEKNLNPKKDDARQVQFSMKQRLAAIMELTDDERKVCKVVPPKTDLQKYTKLYLNLCSLHDEEHAKEIIIGMVGETVVLEIQKEVRVEISRTEASKIRQKSLVIQSQLHYQKAELGETSKDISGTSKNTSPTKSTSA